MQPQVVLVKHYSDGELGEIVGPFEDEHAAKRYAAWAYRETPLIDFGVPLPKGASIAVVVMTAPRR